MIKKTNGEDVVICDVCGITSNEKMEAAANRRAEMTGGVPCVG